MTIEELKALPVGTLLLLRYKESGKIEIGEIIETGDFQATIIWPETGCTVYVGLNQNWASLVECFEVEE